MGCAGFRSRGTRALEHRLSSRGARAQLLCSAWGLPGSGSEPMSPVLAGGFFAGTPGKPLTFLDITKQSPQCIQKLSAATHSFYTFTDHIPEAVQGLLRLISFAAGCVPLDPLLTLPAPHPPPSGNCLFAPAACASASVPLCLSLDPTCKWNDAIFICPRNSCPE